MIRGADVKGVIPALVTPFTKNGDVDLKGVEALATYLLGAGVNALMPVGGTGEFPSLLREEKRDVVATVARVAKGKVPIVAGATACGTREAILLGNDAAAAGADAVIVTAPYYFRLPEESLVQHYTTVAKSIDCPLVVYNNPLYTGNAMGPELLSRLMGVRNIIGVKNSTVDMGQLVDTIRLAPKGRSVCTGIDSQFYAALCIGASGLYSTAAGVIPAQMVKLYRLHGEGSHGAALALSMRLQALLRYLEYTPGDVATAKEALNLMGLAGGYPRAPLPLLTAEERKGVKAALKTIGAL